MPELRQNRFTKEWVILATERAKRPEELKVKRETRPQLPSYSQNCPFCPGNEHLAPPAVCELGRKGSWNVRVVPNKFSALARDGEPSRRVERSRRFMNGVGIHDVIVETRDHSLTTALLPEDDVARILRCYADRFREVSADPRIAHVTIFKNHGAAAGTSLEHPHSQLIGTPVISNQVRTRLHEALRHYDDFGECIFCNALMEELEEQERIVLASTHSVAPARHSGQSRARSHFVALEPFASSTPFATYIYPRRHMASFGDIRPQEIEDLAYVLRTVLAKLYHGLDNPDFNYTIRTAPHENAGVIYYHWYLSIIPRLTRVAGFELGSGMFINTVLPEAAAKFLREVQIEQVATAMAGA